VEVQFQDDEKIYSRLFAEICLYLRQNEPVNDWAAVILCPNRNVDTGNIKHYREFFISQRVRRIYLDELTDATSLPIGLATVKLIVTPEDTAIVQARELIARTKSEINSAAKQQELLQFIETILLYKLPTISREELEAMFSLSELRNTRYFQDVFQEGERSGKLKAVPAMLAAGLTVEQVAQALDLTIEDV
jgi:predicted transposase/invertase (TIGR01784 family)